MMYLCPFCDTLKRKFVDIKKHIVEQHEGRDHWALWVKDLDNSRWLNIP